MKYIVFEGVDGSGKSTQIRLLSDFLSGMGLKVLTIKEPFILPSSDAIPEADEADSFISDRMILMKYLRGIKDSYDVILSDRSFYSTLAYQFSSDNSFEKMRLVNSFAMQPDICFLFHYKSYMAKRSRTDDSNKIANLQRRYFQIQQKWNCFVEIDADREIAQVFDNVKDELIGELLR